MAMINISGKHLVEDANYRYQMPAVVCRTEGSGNGIKTSILNCKDIALHLQRPVFELCKFIEYNMHTHAKEECDRLVINGHFVSGQIQEVISGYIDKFVLCRICRLPEVVYRYKKKDLNTKCLSCGHRDIILDKLSKVIVRIHKDTKKDKPKKDKQKSKPKTVIKHVDTDDDVVWFTDLSDEAVAARAKENTCGI